MSPSSIAGMPSQNAEKPESALQNPRPKLDSLPSEIRRLIVSHLAPDPKHLRPGCKSDLKNANLAHACLREWATEYMFMNMALTHVLPGMASHLDLFAASQEGNELLKHVKHIVVQVPPAIRWEVGVENPFALHLEEITKQRLCWKFGVQKVRQMNDEQQQYASDYHRALVEPFVENRRWHQLFRMAKGSWGQTFRCFPCLEEISVGCCERVDQPRTTYTHAFLLRYGKSAEEEAHPVFVLDRTVNMAWASSLICGCAPSTVKFLNLCMANMDSFSPVTTVNRLLSLGYQQHISRPSLSSVTKLTLSIGGVLGTHGDKDWSGDTGSSGSVRFWKKVLQSMPVLQHLVLRDAMTNDKTIRFPQSDMSDTKESILEWILPGLILEKLRSLRLCGFLIDKDVFHSMFSGHWPRLASLYLDDIKLMLLETEQSRDDTVRDEHLQGLSWVGICQALREKHPEFLVDVRRPLSNVNADKDYGLAKYVGPMVTSYDIDLDVSGYDDSVGFYSSKEICDDSPCFQQRIETSTSG